MNVEYYYDPIHHEYQCQLKIASSDICAVPAANWDHIMDKLQEAAEISEKLKVITELAQVIENMRNM